MDTLAARQRQELSEQQEELSPARQNALLRSYFRNQYLSFRGEGFQPNLAFMERYVDRRIDDFVERLNRQLLELDTDTSRLPEQWKEFSTNRSDPVLRRSLRDQLGRLGNQAQDVRNSLSHIFQGGLKNREDFQPPPLEQFEDCKQCIVELQSQFRLAQEAIRAYFFSTSNTVAWEALGGDNMLIRLYRVEKMAHLLRSLL